jgi:hypothetical protein
MKTSFFLLLLLPLFVNAQESKPQLAFDFLEKYPNTRDITISSDGTEAYFTIQSPMEEISVIAFSKKVKSKWGEPEIVSFTGKFRDMEPFLSSNGLRLYFASNRPLIETIDTTKDFDIWYIERKTLKESWSKPINMGAPVNSINDEFYPSLAENNNLYFTCACNGTKGKDDIYFAEWKNEGYDNPVSLSDSINSIGFEFNAFVSSDESFLIFTGYNRVGGMGSGDLFISWKEGDEWTKAQNMGEEINSAFMDYCPFYDAKQKHFYFTSKRSEINTKQDFKSLNDFSKEISKPENGWSRIYKVNDLDIKLFK